MPNLSISDRGILKSPTTHGFIYFSLQFYHFLLHLLWCFVVRCTHKDHYVLGKLILLSLNNASLYPWYFPFSEDCSTLNNTATLAFFWLVSAWYYLYDLLLYTFNLYMSLFLKWVSCRQHIVGLCLLTYSDLCLLIGAFRPLTFKVIIGIVD